MSALTERLMRNFELEIGYPPDDNEVVKADPESAREAAEAISGLAAPDDLRDFYLQVEEVSLPDVANGLSIASAETVAGGVREGYWPTQVTGAVNGKILVFGTDGGGGLFALNEAADKVYRLTGGAFLGSTYDVDESGVEVVASGFWEFLQYILRELTEAVPPSWT